VMGVKGVRRRIAGPTSLLATMRDDPILDAVVDVGGKHAVIEKVPLGAVGAKADDAGGPGGRHAGNLEQFGHAGAIDVDARRGWWSGFGFGRGLRGAGLRKAGGTLARGEIKNQNCGEEHYERFANLHAIILRPPMDRRQEKDLTGAA
jgi:hypothetical protein